MRTISTAQEAVISSPGMSYPLRVSIKPVGGSFVDITDLEGYNWLAGISYGANIDEYTQSAIVRVHAGRGDIRFETLMASSKINTLYGGTYGRFLAPGAEVKIEAAILAPDVTPTSTDWMEVFRGCIDEVSFNTSPIELRCRDKGAKLNQMIESEGVYPNDENSEAPVEDIMQQILDDNLGAGVVDLYSDNGSSGSEFDSGDSPGWYIRQYIQQKQTVQQALLVLANQIGWQLGYKWQRNDDSFELHFYETGRPVRARGTMTFTDQPSTSNHFHLSSSTLTEGSEWYVESTLQETAQSIADAINSGVTGATAWVLDAEKAIGTMTFTGQPSASDHFHLGSSTLTEGSEWNIGTTLGDTLNSIVNAVNDSSEGCTAYRVGAAMVKIRYDTAGSAGNSVAFNEAGDTMDNCTLDGSGYLGGSYTGSDVRVVIEWDEVGAAGNSVAFNEAGDTMDNCTLDGSGYLGGTLAGSDSSIARTFTPGDYLSITGLDMSRLDVRNRVTVRWGKDPDNQNSITVQDTDSQSQYGLAPCEISLAASDQIDTESEARTLALSVLDALKECDLNHDVELLYFPFVELGDYYKFEANGVNYDTDQSIAVMGFDHSIDVGGKARTVMRCSGKPRGGHKRWLRLESRAGAGDETSDYSANGPVITEIGAGMASMEIEILPAYEVLPALKKWTGVRVYLSTSSGFTPGPSTLHTEVGKQTRITVTGLIPGETYYVRVSYMEERTIFGRKIYGESDYSAEAQVQTQKSSPYHTNEDAIRDSLISNSDFGASTLGPSYPPDNWTVQTGGSETGAWGTNITTDTTYTKTGGTSLEMVNVGSSDLITLRSEIVPITEYAAVRLQTLLYYTGTPGTSTYTLSIYAYDKDKALLGNVGGGIYGYFNVLSTSTWYKLKNENTAYYAGSSARYFSVQIKITGAGSPSSFNVYVDSASLIEIPPRMVVAKVSSKSITQTTWDYVAPRTNVTNAGLMEYSNSAETPPFYGATIRQPAVYLLTANFAFTGFAAGKQAQVRFVIDAGGTPSYIYSNWFVADGSGNCVVSTSAICELTEGQTVDLEVYHDDTTSRTITASVNNLFTVTALGR